MGQPHTSPWLKVYIKLPLHHACPCLLWLILDAALHRAWHCTAGTAWKPTREQAWWLTQVQ
jgi:hypothetical protein